MPGGKERQDSVYNALKAFENEDELEIILVHDGVRPFVTPEQIRRVIDAARRHGGTVLGSPAQDTLKTSDSRRQGPSDPGAPDIWQIQTPRPSRRALFGAPSPRPTAATSRAPTRPPCWKNSSSRWWLFPGRPW